ncbi:hypothetical protein ACFV98_14885 [Streptomyces violascens]|uniref:hypothetical protein n=1 Tax=Streptomyces violascens TaxID=67381 RepID=UPI003656748B
MNDQPRVRCLVAEIPGGEVVGYASCAPELSTWDARAYLTWTAFSCATATAGCASARS